MGNSLMFTLKKWHLSSIRANYVRTQTVRLPDGKEQEVTVFSGEKCIFLAQYTPLGTIAVHERAFADKKLLTYVLTHEIAHKKQWWSLFRLPMAGLAIIYAPGLLSSAIDSLISAVSSQNLHELAYFPLGIFAGTLLLGIPFAFSWLTEFDADFQAIKAVGLSTFLDFNSDQSRLSFNGVINLLTHPPVILTVFLWRRFHPGDERQTPSYSVEPAVSRTTH